MENSRRSSKTKEILGKIKLIEVKPNVPALTLTEESVKRLQGILSNRIDEGY